MPGAPLVALAPAAAPAAAPVGGSVFRLKGLATFNERAFAGASLRLFDVLSEEEYLLSEGNQRIIGADAGTIIGADAGTLGAFDVEAFIPGLISNTPGTLISNQAGGLISNAPGSLISNQAGGLISNAPGSLISNQAGGQNLIAAGGQNLISNQAGGLISNAPAATLRAFRLVAEKNGQALVTVVDSQGRTLSADGLAGYRLQQAGSGPVLLTPATTAVAKAFEGAVKLQFELSSQEARTAGLAQVFDQARQAARAVDAQMRKDPDLARRIAASVDAKGSLRDFQVFKRAATQGQLDRELAPRLNEVLNSFAVRKAAEPGDRETQTGRARLEARDFPVGDVSVEANGAINVRGNNGESVRIDRPQAGRAGGENRPDADAKSSSPGRNAGGNTGGNRSAGKGEGGEGSTSKGPAKETSKTDGPTQDGPTPDGPKKNGPTQGGPTQSGPTQSGPTQSGPTQSGPAQSGPTQSGPTQSGPTQSGPTQSGPTQSGPTQSGPTQSGPTQSGPEEKGPKNDNNNGNENNGKAKNDN
jgi:hypothetical protein